MNDLLDMLNENGAYLLRLVLAMVLGSMVGLERQTRGRPAGLRTNILVCLGSAAIIVAFQKIAVEFNASADSAIRMDPARAAAGVITGIGFLGAGTIVKSESFVRGLTTAASIWVVSAIGVTVGLGEYAIATTLTLLVLTALILLHMVPVRGDRYFTLHLAWNGQMDLVGEIVDQLAAEDIEVRSRTLTRQPRTGQCNAKLNLCTRRRLFQLEVLACLQTDERFDEVSWG